MGQIKHLDFYGGKRNGQRNKEIKQTVSYVEIKGEMKQPVFCVKNVEIKEPVFCVKKGKIKHLDFYVK